MYFLPLLQIFMQACHLFQDPLLSIFLLCFIYYLFMYLFIILQETFPSALKCFPPLLLCGKQYIVNIKTLFKNNSWIIIVSLLSLVNIFLINIV